MSAAGQSLTIALVTNSGDIHLRNTGAVVVEVVNDYTGITILDSVNDNSGQDNVTITTASLLTVLQQIVNADGGNITLAAQGALAVDDLTVQADILASGGNGRVLLYASDSIPVFGGLTISTTGTGEIGLISGTDCRYATPQDSTADGGVVVIGGECWRQAISPRRTSLAVPRSRARCHASHVPLARRRRSSHVIQRLRPSRVRYAS